MAGTVYSDTISTNALPDSMRVIFSNLLEFTARPKFITDQPEFVEIWPEFGAKRGATVTRTVYHQLPFAITPLNEQTDVVGGGLQDHQVSLTIAEYGDARGTTEYLDLLSYHGPISSVIKSALGPQMAGTLDTLARNALWYAPNINGGVQFQTFADGAATDQFHLSNTNVFTSSQAANIAYRLGVRQVPTLGDREPSYIALTHPSVIRDLRNDTAWTDANKYAGALRIFNGEEGMIHGTRFLKSTRYRVANGGKLNYQTTLAAGSYPQGTNTVTVVSTTGMNVGDEITLHATGTAVTAPNQASVTVSWTAPNGTDGVNEELIISSINVGTKQITFTNKLMFNHQAGEFATDAFDIYPMVFMGGLKALAKGVALAPEVRVALPTDKLRRMSYIGWYTLLGYGIARPWSYELDWVTSSVNTPPVFGI